MMYRDQPPLPIETKVFSALPDQFRRKDVCSTWADAITESVTGSVLVADIGVLEKQR